ncbi:MAG: aldo/keto reductase [Spirochaetaceae bacterium]|nr:MAG: aldo/keto reductase [Spirochaetaceae bacterium]
MQYRPLGTTDLTVSAVCLGTMTFGRQNSEADGHAQLDHALDHGVNFVDTAELYAVPPTAETYGKTEAIIGSWFAARQNRDRVILATKIAGDGIAWVRDGKNVIDRQNLRLAVEGSLSRLRTDYIDLYQLHWPNRGSYHFGQLWKYRGGNPDASAAIDNMLEVLQTLGELVAEGKIRHAGLSNETAWGTMQYLRLAEQHGLPRMVSIQNEYSLLNRLFEPDLAEIALREQVGLLAWSPLATGLLAGKYADGARPEGSRWSISTGRNQRDTPQAHRAVAAYAQVAAEHNLSLPQMAIAFVNSRPFVTSTIIGATTLAQLEENLAAFDLSLSDAVLDGIAEVRREYPIPY